MPTLDRIRRSFSAHEPRPILCQGRRSAAVAMILRDAGGTPDVLFIERARHRGDPWSGHMAFPGGRVDPEDVDSRAAAERETLEEVGLSLEDAERIGRLDDMQGQRAAGVSSLVIAGFVYHLPEPAPVVTNYEVEDAFWVPLCALRDPERRVDHPVDYAPALRFPGIRVGDAEGHVVWGLTYRFLEGFFRIVGLPLPERRWP